jgi:Endodeoxyribonuclease RusA
MTKCKPPKTPASTKKKVAAASKKTKKTAAAAAAAASSSAASSSASAATVPKKKSTAAKANYSFDNTSAVQSHKTNHLTFFKCKINGVPRPQARAFPNAQHGQVNIHSPSKANQKMFANAFKAALSKINQCLFSMSGNNVIAIWVHFYFPCPKDHYYYNPSTNKWHLSASASLFVKKTPDLDYCIKLVLNSLQGVCYKNDSTVALVETAKVFVRSHTAFLAQWSRQVGYYPHHLHQHSNDEEEEEISSQ